MRLGPIQLELMAWITAGEYVTIGPGTVPPRGLRLAGLTYDEVKPSLDRLLARGLIVEPKRGFYSLPGWTRPQNEAEMEQWSQRSSKALELLQTRVLRDHIGSSS